MHEDWPISPVRTVATFIKRFNVHRYDGPNFIYAGI